MQATNINPFLMIYNTNPFGLQFSIVAQDNSYFLSRPVEWIREERPLIAKIAVYALAFFVGLLLFVTIIGIPLVILSVQEYYRQEADQKIVDIRRGIWDFQLQVKHALGGEAYFATLPVIDLMGRIGVRNFVNFLTPGMLSSPLAKGTDKYIRDFVAMKVRDRATGVVSVQTIQQLYFDARDWVATQGPVLRNGKITAAELDTLRQIREGQHPQFELAV